MHHTQIMHEGDITFQVTTVKTLGIAKNVKHLWQQIKVHKDGEWQDITTFPFDAHKRGGDRRSMVLKKPASAGKHIQRNN